MKSLSKYLSLLLIAIVFASCSDDSETKTLEGYFKLVQIQSSTNGRVLATSEESAEFDLGDLKASKEFFFLLQSTGGTITDINLESDNPDFVITPGSISELSEDGSIIPLVSVGITHGVHLNGFGFTDILEMGEQSATVTITGKTIVNGNEVNVESSFTFTVNAKVMNIKLFDNETEIDLTSVQITTSGVPNAGGLGAVRGYTSGGLIKIENTGNVDIRIKAVSDFNGPLFYNEVITPGQTASIDISETNYTVISLDGNGTITDNAHIEMGNDGKGYFSVEKTGP